MTLDLGESVDKVTTQEDFVSFVNTLISDFELNSNLWENNDLKNFLEALARISGDIHGRFINSGEIMPDPPSWSVFAELLSTARTYE